MARIKIRNKQSTKEAFEKFLLSKRAQGIADKTAATYSQHFHAIGKHLDTDKDSEKRIYRSSLQRKNQRCPIGHR